MKPAPLLVASAIGLLTIGGAVYAWDQVGLAVAIIRIENISDVQQSVTVANISCAPEACVIEFSLAPGETQSRWYWKRAFVDHILLSQASQPCSERVYSAPLGLPHRFDLHAFRVNLQAGGCGIQRIDLEDGSG